MALFSHQLGAMLPELNAGMGMDGIIDAMVVGHKAAEHFRIGGIHDSVNPKPGDISNPEIKVVGKGGQIGNINDPSPLGLTL